MQSFNSISMNHAIQFVKMGWTDLKMNINFKMSILFVVILIDYVIRINLDFRGLK